MARGHIIKRGSTYSVVIEGLPDPVTGKRTQHWHAGFRTKKVAEEARTGLLREMDTGDFVEPTNLTIRQFLDQWLLAIKGTVRESTWTAYESNVRLHLVPNLGSIKVQRLQAAQLNALYQKLLATGRKMRHPPFPAKKDGKKKDVASKTQTVKERKPGLSPKTVHNVHICIHKALSFAVQTNLVRVNVADNATAPGRADSARTEMRTWSAEDLRRFLEGVVEHPLYPAFVLAAMTGMRRGEVLGLQWEDVELDTQQVSVRNTLTSVLYKVKMSAPKTPRSRRTLRLDPTTVAVLRAHHAKLAEKQLAATPDRPPNGFVFTREDGSPVHPDRFSKVFEEQVYNLGLPRIRLHDLRHTHATLALQNGMNIKVLSDRLGHSSVAFTLDVYAHAVPAMQEEATNRVAEQVFGPGRLQNVCK